MAYTNVWNEATPTSATVANTIAAYWTDNMKAIRERLDDIFGTSAAASINTADPYKPYLLKLTGQANSYIIGGSASLGFVANDGVTYNLKILDAGNIIFRAAKFIPTTGTYSFRDTTDGYDNIAVLDSGLITFRNTITVSAGGASITGRGVIPEYNAGNVTGVTAIDCANGNNQRMTLTGNATLSFTNLVAGTVMILRLKQDGTGSRLVTWTGVTWAGGVAPTLTTTINYSDIISLYYTGTSLLGFIGALGFNA